MRAHRLVELHGVNYRAAREQRARERPEPRADFHDAIALLDAREFERLAHDVWVNQEILPELFGRRVPEGAQNLRGARGRKLSAVFHDTPQKLFQDAAGGQHYSPEPPKNAAGERRQYENLRRLRAGARRKAEGCDCCAPSFRHWRTAGKSAPPHAFGRRGFLRRGLYSADGLAPQLQRRTVSADSDCEPTGSRYRQSRKIGGSAGASAQNSRREKAKDAPCAY